jgi:hypothetical protein
MKESMLQAFKSGMDTLESLVLGPMDVQVLGNVAAVKGSVTATARTSAAIPPPPRRDRTQEYGARRRGEEHERNRFATPETVTLSPLPCWEHLSPEDQKEKVAELVR